MTDRGRLWERLRTYGFSAAVVVVLLFLVTCCRFYLVPTASMDPVIAPGARIVALTVPYGLTHRLARGDVAVFDSPVDFPGQPEGETLVKRVVAVGGDEVLLSDGTLYVNGKPSPWQGESANLGSFAITVPDGRYFMMGDNRVDSLDSRYFGTVDAQSVRGKAVAVYLPYLRGL